jgi:hypothetical protein
LSTVYPSSTQWQTQSGTQSPSSQGIQSATQTSSPTSQSNTTTPPAAQQANPSTTERDLALGFGLTTALLVTGGILVGFFARQAAFNAYTWAKNKITAKRPKANRTRHYQRSAHNTVKVRNPIESNVIHLNMNPAMIHQQTTLDILNLARQQRLEAIQAQQQQVTQQDDQTLSRIKSFKKVYQPIKAPGSSV